MKSYLPPTKTIDKYIHFEDSDSRRMRWFRRPSATTTSPRLLSHSTISPEQSLQFQQYTEDPETGHRSRIDGTQWQRQSSAEDSESEATHCYSVQTRLVVVEKPRRWRSEPRASSSTEQVCDRIAARREAFILAREKRNPLLDHVKDTRLSCFPSCELLTEFPLDSKTAPSTPTSSVIRETPTEKFLKNPKLRKRNTDTHESFNANSCLSAKLKSISDRYLKCPTNRLLSKLYKEEKGKSSKSPRRQRSFSYGSLPGLEHVQDRENPLFLEEGADLLDSGRKYDAEDGDSGIIVTDTSSLMESVNKSFHARSASGEQHSPSSRTRLYTDSRDSWSSDQSHRSFKAVKRKKVSRRSVSLDRREILRKYQAEANESPPQEVSETAPKRVFKVVKLFRSSPIEEIGIFIAKTKLCGEISQGYLIAHIVPDGLAERDGTLRVGDEIVNVNGRRLRGLSMPTAREILGSGPIEVDIVVARSELDGSQNKRHSQRMRESSVDYENVILKPRERARAEPVVALPCHEPESLTTCVENFQPKAASSPNPTRAENFRPAKTGNSMNSKMLRKALISYSEQDEKKPPRNGGSCDNLLSSKGNFCTMPRLPKSTICSFYTASLEKGPGKKSLGFTIVGGKDSPRGPLGIFVKSILEKGQAADEGTLRVGDEILAVNGQVCHDLTHTEAVAIFKKVKVGPLSLHICRRSRKQQTPVQTKSCTDLLDSCNEVKKSA